MAQEKRCSICGGLLQKWEVSAHPDCSKRRGYPEPDIDWLEWADEYNERVIDTQR